MKKYLLIILLLLPLTMMAQSSLTPQQQLEKAQRELEEAQKALDAAKQNAEKAKAEAEKAKAEAQRRAEMEAQRRADEEARKQTEELQRKAAEARAEAERLNAQAEEMRQEAEKTTSEAESNQTASQWSMPTDDDTAVSSQEKTKASTSNNSDDDISRYLEEGAVPVVDGYVSWTETVAVPGASASTLYNRSMQFLKALTSQKDQLQRSRIALVNKKKHSVAATVEEYLTFTNNFIALDRSEVFYVLQADCKDGEARLQMSRISYRYDQQGDVSNLKAEKWITDDEAVNKKRTRLMPFSGKFRRATIDRKDAIFSEFAEAVKKSK